DRPSPSADRSCRTRPSEARRQDRPPAPCQGSARPSRLQSSVSSLYPPCWMGVVSGRRPEPVGLADDQSRAADAHATFGPLASDPADQEGAGGAAKFLHRVEEGGQRRMAIGTDVQIVITNDGTAGSNAATVRAQAREHAERR